MLAMPYPAQGHVIPMMEVAQRLAESGIRVTFVNTDFNHERIVKALSQRGGIHELITLVSIPDGLEHGADRNDLAKLQDTMPKVMPAEFEALVNKIHETEGEKLACVVTEYGLGWAFAIAKKLEIRLASFLPAPVALLAQTFNVQKLISDGIIDSHGE